MLLPDNSLLIAFVHLTLSDTNIVMGICQDLLLSAGDHKLLAKKS